MVYETFQPHSDLSSLVKCYWTLEVPAGTDAPKQRIVPDGCIEMAFILGDDIRRFTSEDEFVLQPRAMILGQITAPFYIQPVGYVDTFAVRFYPYGFANFVTAPLKGLSDKETPIADVFGDQAADALTQRIVQARNTLERVKVTEDFLLSLLERQGTVDEIVRTTVDALISTRGTNNIQAVLKDDLSKRRQLERKFLKQIGVSPKQLGKVIRLQAALKMLLNNEFDKFTDIAYESEYYDQAHFIKDFKEFTGTSPTAFLGDEAMALSSLIYKRH